MTFLTVPETLAPGIYTLERRGDIVNPVPTRMPVGKGILVWQVANCTGGSPGLMANMASAGHFDWVAFKIHNGVASYNGNLLPWIDALKANGIDVWSWGYLYGYDPIREAQIAVNRMNELGIRGYLADAETEYKLPGKASAARTFVAEYKRLTDKPMGLCSYRYPTLHPELPWAEFLAGSEFHAPQLYWIRATAIDAPSTQLRRSMQELQALKPLPFVPIGTAVKDDYSEWRPTVAQLDNFHQGCEALLTYGEGWYSWDGAEKHLETWNAISAHRR